MFSLLLNSDLHLQESQVEKQELGNTQEALLFQASGLSFANSKSYVPTSLILHFWHSTQVRDLVLFDSHI